MTLMGDPKKLRPKCTPCILANHWVFLTVFWFFYVGYFQWSYMSRGCAFFFFVKSFFNHSSLYEFLRLKQTIDST